MISIVKRWVEENDYRIINSHSNNPQAIILGESHESGFQRDQQTSLIEQIQPDYVLHESALDRMYNPFSQREQFIDFGRVYRNEILNPKNLIPKHLIELANQFRCMIIGCDLSNKELGEIVKKLAEEYPEEYYYNETSDELGDFLDYGVKNSEFGCHVNHGVIPFREKHMGNIILEYVPKATKPLITILGANHIQQQSKIYEVLFEKGVSYMCVNQNNSS